jgi:two-component system, cell cycle sensor histidine kinase and response regulator CckA
MAGSDGTTSETPALSLRDLTRASPFPCAVLHQSTETYAAVNEAFAALMGGEASDFEGRDLSELAIWRDDPAIQAQIFEKLKRDGAVNQLDARLRRPDGSVCHVRYSAKILSAAHSNFVVEGFEPMDELHQVRNSRRGLDAKFEALFNGSSDGISIHELDGTIIEVNQRLCDVFGIPRESFLGRNGEELHEEYMQTRAAEMFQSTRARRSVDFESKLLLVNGSTQPVEIRMQRVEIIGAPVVIATYHDLSARQALQQQLLQSQKMEAIGRLASGVSHDFNNILTVIRGLAFILQDALPPDHEEQGTVEELDRAAQRAAGLTRQLLVFSRRKDADSIELDVAQVIRDLNRMLRRLVPASIELGFEYADDLPPASVDPGQVEHLIAMLAVRAKERGTHTGLLEFSTRSVTVNGSPCAALVVYDNGVEASPEALAQFNGDSDRRADVAAALHLGEVLATCDRLDATTSLIPYKEAGVAIQIVFPPMLVSEDSSELEGPQAMEQLTGRETILLAEDEASLRTLVAAGLRRYGYEVICCADPLEALNASALHPAPIDLLITDIVMPHGTGAELAAKLREAHPMLKVLFVSGYAEADVLEDLPEGPNSAFIQKVFTQQDLLRAVRLLLDSVSG